MRPTADRVRETIFNILGQWLSGEAVLDLYAGAGGLGLEALSRGAGRAVFVEHDRRVMPVLAENVRALGFAASAETLLSPADRALERLGASKERFALVFSDPPYALHAGAATLEALDRLGLVDPGGRVVVEHDRREELPEQVGELVRDDVRRFGDTLVSFYRRGGEPDDR